MSSRPPGSGPNTTSGFGGTQAPTMFAGGPPIEKKEIFNGRSAHSTELTMHVLGGLLAAVGFVLVIVLFFFSAGLLSFLGLILSMAGGVLILLGFVRVISVQYRVD